MEFSFENQGTNTFLVYTVKPEDSIDTLSLGMLTNNKIAGLAPTQFYQMDMSKYIKYNISSHISVKQFFEGAVNRKRLLGVFRGIVNALLSAEDYMIDVNSIVIDLNYMFADVSSCETELICLPIVDAVKEQQDLGVFFKNIMFSTQFDQTDNCDYIARIINYLNSTSSFTLTEFKHILESIDNGAVKSEVIQKAQPVVSNQATNGVSTSQAPLQQTVQSQAGTNPEGLKQTLPVQQPENVGMKPSTSHQVKSSGMQPPSEMVMPGKKNPVTVTPTEDTSVPTVGQEITWLYLMQHYNKENAAAYKAQKEAKKRAAASSKGKAPAQQPPAQKKPQNASPADMAFGFAVLGQATPAAQPAVQQVAPAQKSAPQTGSTQTPANTTPAQQPAYVPREVPQGQAANFGETTVLGGGAIGETTVLTAAQNPNKMIAPHLIRKKNNEKISLNKPVFRVGKERSYVDYFIGDNTAISRSHANFITREGEYFVVDTNSTNHTFVNGTMINSNEEIKINHGDTIRLANEDFDFKLY